LDKIRVYHFNNGNGGGVLSVISNLLAYKQHEEIENHVIYTINRDRFKEFEVPGLVGAASEQVFNYSPKWNFYHTCKQLARLLPDEKTLIVAHDWLELGMVSNLGLQNPVVQFLHGAYDYYYNLAKAHSLSVSKFITVSQNIQDKLQEVLQERTKDIYYLRFPIRPVLATKILTKSNSIIFIGRLSKQKGYHLLPSIAKKVVERLPGLKWHIVGEALHGIDDVHWDENIEVNFYGNIPNEQVLQLLDNMKCFILPSIAEGMPVSLIEAMKAGVVPLVNDLVGGIQEIMNNGETGYKIVGNEINVYAEKIIELFTDVEKWESMSRQCKVKANGLFDPLNNTNAIEECFLTARGEVKKNKPTRVYGSRLDQPWIPNSIVKMIRNIH